MSAMPMSLVATEPETSFDFGELLNETRCHSNDSLRLVVREERVVRERARLREMAATRVLDERGALEAVPDVSVSARTAKSTLEVARALESMPQIAAAVWEGDVSWDQVQPMVELATPDTDAEWAGRGGHMSPGDLHRLARQGQRPTAADAEARHAARSVRSWQHPEQGMSAGKWWLPDVDGVLLDKVLEHMAERMRPEKGQPWDTLAHRKADALMELARSYADQEPTGRFRYEVVNIIDPNARHFGPSVDGIPIAEETLAALMPQAKVRDCVVDEAGVARTVRGPRPALPKDVERHVRRRDTTCRVPGCNATRGLHIHHLSPRFRHGDTFDPHDLAGVCPHHHHLLDPHGPHRLVGDAEEPDGLRLAHRDDMPRNGPDP
jgi:hypothetical protein